MIGSKKILTLFIALLCYAGFATAQDSLAHTLLWKISGNGLKSPSYLYGTMHTGDDRVFRLSDSTMAYFDAAQAFAMEVNADSIDKTALASEMMLPNGETLNDLLGDDDYKLAGKYTMASAGVPIFLVNHLKPIYVWLFIAQGKPNKKEVLDMYYFDLAKKEGKKTIGLEKVEDQMKLLQDIPLTKQVFLLREGIHNYKELKASMNETTVDYADADLNKLLREAQADTTMGANFMDDFVNKRNKVMAAGIERVIQSGTTLFTAVGAAHLPGPQGVIALLKKDGYTVSPVISKTYLKAKDVKRRVK